MSRFTTIRDRIEAMFSQAFGLATPIAEHVVTQTGEAIAAAAIAGTVHGTDDMVKVATDSLKAQMPELKLELATAAGALMTHDAATQAATPAPTPDSAGL
jgi:hypothetical protein